MLDTIKETVSFIKDKTGFEPGTGIILGTGLGGMVSEIKKEFVLDYEDIPNFPVSTVESHHGNLIFGSINGKKVVAMQGRFHYYEGYTMQEVTFPVRVMKYLGIRHLFVSNASGGVNPGFGIGDLMIINVREGCYVATTGPTLETPKEYVYFRNIGGDTVGMSTVPEIIVAHQMGITCFAISIITDLGVPGKIVKVSLDDVKGVAEEAEPKMTLIMKELITSL